MSSPEVPSAPADPPFPQTVAAPPRPPLTPWQARLFRRASRADLVYAGVLLAVAATAVWSGNAAALHLSPGGAQAAASLLDQLELPRVLPDAALAGEDGTLYRLWSITTAPATIVSFYAPWCGPCQQELPILVEGTAAHPERLVVVTGADEDAAEVRRQLDNLGLSHVPFHVDATGQLQAGGRVTALPTTFLLGRMGRVQDRIVGSSEFRLRMLLYKLAPPDGAPPSVP